MTVVEEQPYLAAIKETLATAGLNVGSGVAPPSPTSSLPTPYVVVYGQPSRRFGDSAGEHGPDAVLTFRIVAVDITDEGAADYAARARAALVGAQPIVAGRWSSRIRWDRGTGALRDPDLTPPIFYESSHYTVISTRAPAPDDEES